MKKIIYSLVAMLFMGSVFTSCIPNTEPEGVTDMRKAHAEYLRKLAELVDANKAVAAAEAAFKNAQAAVKQAIARGKDAEAVAQEIKNAVAQAKADKDIADYLDKMEQDRVNNEKALLDAKKALAQAQKDFEDALAAIEIEKLSLSTEEVTAINTIRTQYMSYAAKLEAYYQSWKDYYSDMYDWLLDAVKDNAIDMAESNYLIRKYEKEIELKEFELAYAEQEVDFWEGLLDDMTYDYLVEAQAYEDSAEAMAPLFADLLRDSVLFMQEYGYARDEAIRHADTVKARAIEAPKDKYEAAVDALKKANPKWKSMVSEPADIDNAKQSWKAIGGAFKFEKKYTLPDHSGMAPDLIEMYKTQFDLLGFVDNIEFKDDTLFVKIDAQKDSAAYAAVVDTIWNGNQATKKLLKKETGLWTVYKDFERDYLFDIDAKGVKEDAKLIEAYLKDVKAEYDSILKILKGAKEGQGQKLVNAWATKVENAGKDIDKLKGKVDEYTNKTGDSKYNVYTWDDKVTASSNPGPRLQRNYSVKPRLISQATDEDTHFILDTVTKPWFGVDPTNKLTIAPTKADSLLVFNAVVDYFKAIASINEKSVPYLKFIAAIGSGNFKVDSVRADKLDFEGMRMKKTNAYLEGVKIYRAAAYDNKGIQDPEVAPTDATNYVDAFTNLMELFYHYTDGVPATLSTGVLGSPIYKAWDDKYSAATSGVADYLAYVKDFKDNNSDADLDGFQKVFAPYTAKDFAKYTAMSDEGKAVANWMAANETYFGVEGFAGFGEKVFFDYETFTDPTWVVVFDGIPTYGYTYDKKGNVDGIEITANSALATPSSYQLEFVLKAIKANLTGYDNTYTADDYLTVPAGDMVMNSLVFKLLNAQFLYDLATNSASNNEIWKELGELLEQVKKDMDDVDATADATTAANKALADKFNELLKTYRAETKAINDAHDKAVKEANDAYDKAYDEIMVPILDKYLDLKAQYDYYKGIADGLRDAYASIWADGKKDEAALKAALLKKYEDALAKCQTLAKGIEKMKQALAKLEADIETFNANPLAGFDYKWDPIAEEWVVDYAAGDWKAGELTFDNEAFEELLEGISLLNEILAEFEYNQVADLEFWYEYWKAAYEAALEYVQNK